MPSFTFSAVGQVGPVVSCMETPPYPRQTTWQITGAFTATIALQYTQDLSLPWQTIQSFTSTTGPTKTNLDGYYRWACTAYTSGSPVGVLTTDPVIYTQINNSRGMVVFQADENGVIEGPDDVVPPAGYNCETISATASSASVAATGTVGNVASISLTPGYWEINGSFTLNQGATGLTTGSVVNCSIVTTTATNGTQGTTMSQCSATLTANGFWCMSSPTVYLLVTANTTVYLTEQCAYTAGTPTVSGRLDALRLR